MSKTIKEEKLRWVLPIISNEIRIKDAMKICPYGQRSLERWISNYKKYGEVGLENKSTRPKSNSRETPIRIKERIIELRRQEQICALKLNYKLIKEGIYINTRTIGKIIKNEKLTRKYRIRKVNYKYIKEQLAPGELVEIDVKYVPSRVNNKRYYQFTAIDCSTRWRYLSIKEDMTNYNSIKFLKEVIQKAPFKVLNVKTDNGTCFTNRYLGYQKSTNPFNPRLHKFDIVCKENNITHYLIDPGKPAQNGQVERSHRTDQEMFYDRVVFTTIDELTYKIKLWNMHYNDLEHISLNGKTPNEMIQFYTTFLH